ncbi:universal stress protein [Mycolicibacterium doricum]|uniref:Universal stress protein n=1 Tax=Mycolicibacterium doricum TaxID=126673 RepID=A0A1X1T750_9MYCO|nr:universal stress protein [Mycolicibacterium doricum]MCV7267144.1 universal stress protein [Mycolicibacterium doricum]ORV40338.1 universal stress protein [Mycolicibacterium doricum]
MEPLGGDRRQNASPGGILVGVDGSAESDAAIRWATHEALMRRTRLTLVHVAPPVVGSWPMGPVLTEINAWQQDNAQHVLDQALETARASGPKSRLLDMHTEILVSSLVPTLVHASESAEMVVVGSRGTGALGRVLLGSVSTGLVHHARCPVAVIRPLRGEPDGDAPVLLGVDGSPASEAATALAFDEAARRRVDLVALHAWSDVAVFPMLGMNWHRFESQGHEVLAERLAGWQEQYPEVRVHRHVVCDQPARSLLRESERAQLVVVGSRGRGGIASTWLGSVSSAVAQSADVPMLVVPGATTATRSHP